MIKKNCNVLCFLVNLFILLLFEYNYIIANPIKNDEVKLDLSVNKDNWFIIDILTKKRQKIDKDEYFQNLYRMIEY